MSATHLECTWTGQRVDSEQLVGLSEAGKPLFARYDLERLKGSFTREAMVGRRADLWRYAEVLPVRDAAARICLGEGWTPLVDAPRTALNRLEGTLIEMPRHGHNSFCCGAGGAQFWKEEEPGDKAVNLTRLEEAQATGAEVLAVGCPFCMQMFETAKSSAGGGPEIKDVVELIAERLPVQTG